MKYYKFDSEWENGVQLENDPFTDEELEAATEDLGTRTWRTEYKGSLDWWNHLD